MDSYLELPVDVVIINCLYPLKYLRYLGYVILELEGRSKDIHGNEIDYKKDFYERGSYLYLLDTGKMPQGEFNRA